MSRFQAICPVCGAFGAPEIFLAEAVKREAIAKALRMPSPLALQVQAYIGLFRPIKRGHSLDRIDRLLADLLAQVEPQTINRKGRTLPAPVDIWEAALDEVLAQRHRLRLPLKDHGYLFEIVLRLADRQAAQAEREHIEQMRNRPQPGTKPTGNEEYDPMQAWKKDLENIGRTDLIPEKHK